MIPNNKLWNIGIPVLLVVIMFICAGLVLVGHTSAAWPMLIDCLVFKVIAAKIRREDGLKF